MAHGVCLPSNFKSFIPGCSFSFARPKENKTKEKGARNQAHFPLETRYTAPMGRLPTGLQCAALFLDVSPLHAI